MTRRARLVVAGAVTALGLVGVWASNYYDSDLVAGLAMALVFGGACAWLK